MKLNRVTLTGADDKTSISSIFMLAHDYPFAEFAALASKDSQGAARFPSVQWLCQFLEDPDTYSAVHLCGQWLLDLCRGNPTIFQEIPSWCFYNADRIQFNFAHQVHKISENSFVHLLKEQKIDQKELIFQVNQSNFDIVRRMKEQGIERAVPFFDQSCGNGVVPDSWPSHDGYCGYAGGLDPNNIEDQLKRLEDVVGDREIWIDAESGLRDDKDRFSLTKAQDFLSKCEKWVQV